MKLASSALFLLLSLLPACAGASPSPPEAVLWSAGQPAPDDPVPAEILTELQGYYADFSARDWERFSDRFWPGATLTTVWTPPGEEHARVVVTGVPEFVAKAPEGPGSASIFAETMTSATLRIEGDLAQVWARYDARFGEPGRLERWQGIDAFTLLRYGERWRIVALVYAPE